MKGPSCFLTQGEYLILGRTFFLFLLLIQYMKVCLSQKILYLLFLEMNDKEISTLYC